MESNRNLDLPLLSLFVSPLKEKEEDKVSEDVLLRRQLRITDSLF